MVQGMAELVQRSDSTGETANYPATTSPFSENSQNKTTSEMSPAVSADVSNDDSVSVDSSSSDDERRSNESVRSVRKNPDDTSGDFKSSISTSEPFVPSVVIPRTVPCIVLTPPVPFNPGLPLAHNFSSALGGKAVPENSHIMPPLIENPFLYGSIRNSSVFSGTKSDNKSEKSLNLTLGRKGEKDAGECKDATPKKLAFGIDRILSEENEDAGLNLMMKPKPRHGHPIEFNLKSYHNNHSEDHHNHHQQHQHQGPASDSYASQCSECFFLARYCRRIQFPLTSTAVASPFSWIPSPAVGHPTESSSSSILPPNGFGQPHHIPYGLSSSSYANMSPMVSCNTSGNGRRKRSWSRAVFSNLQRKGLEKRFQLQKYITKPDRRQLAATLGLTDAQVKVWFQNRRMKWRHSKEGKQGTHVASSEDTKTLTSEKK